MPHARPALRRALLSLTALTCPALALAQDSQPTVLQEIVVTAAGFEQNVAEAPASITVISGEELARRNVTTLTDALREVQGVVVTGIANEQDINIRGLGGGYTLILVDGKRQGTRESRTNGAAGIEQSFIPPVSAIERIEVVRGPMSSLYGSDAMGGVVNIITKPVADVWGGSVTVETTLPQRDEDGASRQLSFSANGPLIADQLGLQIWGRFYDRSEARIVDGLRDREQLDLTGRLTWAINPEHELRFEAGRTRIEDTGRAGRSIADVVNGVAQNDSIQVNTRKHASLTYGGQWGNVRSDISLLREVGQRKTYSGNGAVGMSASMRQPEVTNTVLDAKFTAPLEWQGQHMLVFGGQYNHNSIADQNPGLGDGVTYDFSTAQWALFVEDEWQLRDDFALTLGVRYNDHREFGGKVTPRIYGVWNASPELTLKGGITTGYRAPSIRSIVPGYYYTTQRGAGVIVSNPDLKPEESTNYELAALYEAPGWSVGATLFRTDFKNKIESYNTGTPITVGGTSYNRWDWLNVGEAVIQGAELTADWDATDTLTLRASYSLTDSEQKTGNYAGLPLERTPRHMASISADWVTPVEGLEAWGTITYHGKEVNAGARIGSNGTPYAYDADGNTIAYQYASYTTVDIGASYQVTDRARLNGAIYNLFDRDINSTSNNTVGEGRRLWLGLTAEF
ncbi:MAG: TonB-dependent receptor [Paracoccus sp. (in: a-proteobacteria)]|uniref:TonB-dependent receptor domain-containing protein n=1 Tax=Paracoccus sp. TaxID=267 RepID=UPI0026E078DE|nr:TonB-dependent receptor [Paracoccus sp. (in: a-proteobacteria)]MDO5613667.1 TonB-dependent receptor [Paracoccus sp. (in: a-proteobacteria)]